MSSSEFKNHTLFINRGKVFALDHLASSLTFLCIFSLQAADDLDQGIEGVTLIPADNGSNKAEVIDGVVNWVEGAMAKDRKVTALKTLQVRWRHALLQDCSGESWLP